jgi:hypothetical protein
MEDKNELFEEKTVVQTVDLNDKGKMRTFHMKHHEEMNYNCKVCGTKISAHNRDWHASMCDSCYDKKVF